MSYATPAYYASETASLYEPKRPLMSNGKELPYNTSYTATFVGFLRLRSEYTVRRLPNGFYLTNGFGHLNGSAGELIVETILDLDLAPPPPTVTP